MVTVTAAEAPWYSDEFPALRGLYQEDSWVLEVTTASDSVAFRLEAALMPDHPRFTHRLLASSIATRQAFLRSRVTSLRWCG
jgi:hypothetical protein